VNTEAGILWGIGEDWNVEEVELSGPREGEMLVRLAASGLCHSDDHARTGDIHIDLPQVGGHEGAGTVEEVGPGVTRLKRGDHIVLAFLPACGHCRWCSTGHQNLCDTGANVITGRMFDGTFRRRARGQDVGAMASLGTFSPYSVVHENSAVKIDDDIPLELAALVGCGVTTGWGAAVNRAQVQPGETVVVVGVGGLGMSAVQGARVSGAEKIIAVDPVEFKRTEALRFGATHTAASMEEALPIVQEETRGVMADKAVMTVSLAHGNYIGPFMALVRKGGRGVVTSVAPPSVQSVDLDLNAFVLSQKELVGNVFGGANQFADIPKLLRLYKQGLLKLEEMVTTNYKLAELPQGYKDLLAGKNIRGLIRYD
jgi:S-(hydroxymethyl)glutathione dehydrogenase/alcohol dehydrogenase